MAKANALDLEFSDSQWITMGDHSELYLTTGDFTIEYWLRTEQRYGWDGWVTTFLGSPPYPGWTLGLNDAQKPVFRVYDGAAWHNLAGDTTTVLDETWYHIAVTYDDSETTAKVWVDGTLEGTDASYPSPAGDTGCNLIVGGNQGGQYCDGDIQCVRISNTLRYTSNFTPATSLFNNDANTLGLWWFDDNLTDQSTNSFNGSLGGGGSEVYVEGTLDEAIPPVTGQYLAPSKYWCVIAGLIIPAFGIV